MIALYRRLLGERFEELPAQVQALHDVTAQVTWAGRADVERGKSITTRLLATVLGLPPAGRDLPLSVTFTPLGEAESWTRTFGSKPFTSTQSAARSQLHERVGPVVLRMTLQPDATGLSLALVGARLFGVPVPRPLLPLVRTRESECGGRYRFEVEAVMPVLGLLVRYDGWLERAAR